MGGLDPELTRLLGENANERDAQSAAAVARRRVVMSMRAAGTLRTGEDQVAAAMLLVQSGLRIEVEAAQALALAAMARARKARVLAATAYDRLRLLDGVPQKFGTQVVRRESGPELWPVDPTTTDSERAKWDVAPLAELLRRAAGT